MLSVTPIYAALLTFLILLLSVRVSLVRRRLKISVGDANEPSLMKAIRTHSNGVENIPLGIALLAILELQGPPDALVHLAGVALLVGRSLHAWGLGSNPQVVFARVYGAYITLFSLFGLAVANLILAIF